MLTLRQVATLRAALLYWQEEMCPHGKETMLPYMEDSGIEPLSPVETAELCDRLDRDVRYAVYDSARNRLDGPELFYSIQEAELAADGQMLATVLVPSVFSQED